MDECSEGGNQKIESGDKKKGEILKYSPVSTYLCRDRDKTSGVPTERSVVRKKWGPRKNKRGRTVLKRKTSPDQNSIGGETRVRGLGREDDSSNGQKRKKEKKG